MHGGVGDEKIRRAFIKETMPLLDVWISACGLDEVEAEILRLKLFDDRGLTEEDILEELKERYNYYYSERYFRKHWRSIKRKIYSIIP